MSAWQMNGWPKQKHKFKSGGAIYTNCIIQCFFRMLFSENSTTIQHLVANSGRIFNPLIAHIVCKLPTQCDDMFPISITIHHKVCIKSSNVKNGHFLTWKLIYSKCNKYLLTDTLTCVLENEKLKNVVVLYNIPSHNYHQVSTFIS